MGKESKKAVSLMFSGGVDSTFAAVKLADDFDIIHLLTYTNSYAHFSLKRAKNRFQELVDIVGPKFSYELINVKDVFDSVVLNDIVDDYVKYKSGFIWCMSCKMVMHAQTIIYNRQRGIDYSCDGSSASTKEMVEQMSGSLELIKDFYKSNNMKFFSPIYDIPREEEVKSLKKMGFFMGKRVWNRHLGIQPRCVPGEIYYLPYILFNKYPDHVRKNVSDYINNKSSKLQKIIEDSTRK